MVIFIGGIVAVVLGIIWVVLWFAPLLAVLGAVVPLLLLIGGAIAVYLGIDELRYPPPKYPPERETVPEESRPSSQAEEDSAEEPERKAHAPRFLLISYTAKNVEVVREKGIIAFPNEREEVLKSRFTVGDKLVLYAPSPNSSIAGIVELAGDPQPCPEMPFHPSKKGELWEFCREVRPISLLPSENWVEARELFNQLDLLKEARNAGKDLARAFGSKLRDIPELTSEDYERISRALEA